MKPHVLSAWAKKTKARKLYTVALHSLVADFQSATAGPSLTWRTRLAAIEASCKERGVTWQIGVHRNRPKGSDLNWAPYSTVGSHLAPSPVDNLAVNLLADAVFDATAAARSAYEAARQSLERKYLSGEAQAVQP